MKRHLKRDEYLLDSDVFISGKRQYYGMDFCPAFWDWLIRKNKAAKLFSIDRVQDEFEGHDELAHWGRKEGISLFEPSSGKDIHPAMQQLSGWVDASHYMNSAKAAFWAKADGYLVSCGLTYQCTVVTLEVSALESKKKIKIPDACKAMKVDCITPFDMLRRENARFILERK